MEAQVRDWQQNLSTELDFLSESDHGVRTDDIHMLRRAFFQRHLDKGLKAKHLAKHCGISASMLTMLLKGERNLGAEAQGKIERKLGLQVGCFSNPDFLKETLLCDFSTLNFTPVISSRVESHAQRGSQSSVRAAPVFKMPEPTEKREQDKTQQILQENSNFDLSSLSQMVLLSKCQVSVETIGVKGSELTLMVKLKF